MSKRLFVLAVFVFFISICSVYSQLVSEKQDVTIFELSYYNWEIPEKALASIDSEIQSVFINMGRFNVIGMMKRFSTGGDLEAFIAEIRALKLENVEIPDEVNYGHMSFTKADLDRLVGSFVVILPEVTHLETAADYNDDDEIIGYKAELKISLTILNAEDMSMVAKPNVETSGYGETAAIATQDAINAIASYLSFEIKSVSIFTLKTGALQVYGGGMTLEKGRNMGILKGFEFKIIREEVLSNGLKRERDSGLVVVNQVSEETSEATIITGEVVEGDQLVEVPRVGAVGQLYVHGMATGTDFLDTSPGIGDYAFVMGLKSTLAMNVYDLRPFLGIEIPLVPIFSDAAPFSDLLNTLTIFYGGFVANVYIGGEYNMIIPKSGLAIAPSLAIGIGIFYPYKQDSAEEFMFTTFGGKAMLNISYHLNYDVMLNAEFGYAHWQALSNWINTYGGSFFGIAISFKI
ncbi:MAG: hypothetical protein JXR70_15970 [Spirochaetales bacterium]|nr:hypothetical protein [Spirochaetales bacterium]